MCNRLRYMQSQNNPQSDVVHRPEKLVESLSKPDFVGHVQRTDARRVEVADHVGKLGWAFSHTRLEQPCTLPISSETSCTFLTAHSRSSRSVQGPAVRSFQSRERGSACPSSCPSSPMRMIRRVCVIKSGDGASKQSVLMCARR